MQNGSAPTSPADIPDMISKARAAFLDQRSRPIAYRKQQLKMLACALQGHEEQLIDALPSDLGRDAATSKMLEIWPVRAELKTALASIDSWAKPSGTPFSMIWSGTRPRVLKDPKGVTLIVSAFNYPLLLAIVPMIGAIAAGNAVILKPSEGAPAVAALLAQILPAYLEDAMTQVVLGGKEVMTVLLAQRWDHIFFTGGSVVGRIVAVAAAEQLCPVTLELGGKSPCIVAADCSIKTTAKRILWGKALNAGQTCIAPDYILVPRSIKAQLVAAFQEAVREFYPDGELSSANQCHYASTAAYERAKTMLADTKGSILIGGKRDDAARKIEFTLVETTLDDKLMEEEVFGSVLPLIEYDDSIDQAVEIVNRVCDSPLALYVFTSSSNTFDYVRHHTRSGSIVRNDCVSQGAVPGLPFGGVGESGLGGSYHSQSGFDLFSNHRSSMHVPWFFEPFLAARYRPFTSGKLALLQFITNGSPFSFSRPAPKPQMTHDKALL